MNTTASQRHCWATVQLRRADDEQPATTMTDELFENLVLLKKNRMLLTQMMTMTRTMTDDCLYNVYTLWGIKNTPKFFYHNFYNTWPILIEIDMQCLG